MTRPRWVEPLLSAPEPSAVDGSARRATARSATLIILATAVSGLAGYVVTALVAVVVSVEEYTVFAVLWSALFLVVGAMGGLQQEVARSAHEVGVGGRSIGRAHPVVVAAVASGGLALVLAATSPLWSAALLPEEELGVSAALVVGASAYVLVAVLAGALYGLEAWRPLAAMIALDGVLRLVLVVIALALSPTTAALAWAVVVPFPVAVLVVAPWLTRRARSLALDVGYRMIAANAARTIIAATATAVIISGFPALLRGASPGAAESTIGPLILVLTLTRAPLVIPVMAMQSWLIVWFRRDAGRTIRRVVSLSVGVMAVAGGLAIILSVVGPPLLAAAFGRAFGIDGGVIAGLVASSGLVAALCITGPALVARSQHSANTVGWLAAAGALVAALALPLEATDLALLALAAGPLVGLVVHVVALTFGPRPSIRAAMGHQPTT